MRLATLNLLKRAILNGGASGEFLSLMANEAGELILIDGQKQLNLSKGVGGTVSLAIGNVETIASSDQATAAVRKQGDSYYLDLGIPRGADGEDGGGEVGSGTPGASAYEIWLGEGNSGTVEDFLESLIGESGGNGAAATIEIGTITTGAPGSAASVVNTGTSSAAILDFTIPKGDTGGSGGGATAIDYTPSAYHSFDQEFTTGVNSAWLLMGTSVNLQWGASNGRLVITMPPGSGVGPHVIHGSLPSGDFIVYCKVRRQMSPTVGNSLVSFGITDGTKLSLLSVDSTGALYLMRWSTLTSFSANAFAVASGDPRYFKILRYKGVLTYSFSVDGECWITGYQELSTAFLSSTITCAIGGYNNQSATHLTGEFDFVRCKELTSPRTYTLAYSSSGDANGVVYLLGTALRHGSFKNPHTTGYITVVGSAVGGGAAANLVDRTTVDNFTTNALGSYWCVDLGGSSTLVVNGYSIRNRSATGNFMRNWKLQGSNNVASNTTTAIDAATWTDIDTRTNDATLNAALNWSHFTVAGQVTGYRWLRLVTTGATSDGGSNYFMCLSQVEFYGAYTCLSCEDLP